MAPMPPRSRAFCEPRSLLGPFLEQPYARERTIKMRDQGKHTSHMQVSCRSAPSWSATQACFNHRFKNCQLARDQLTSRFELIREWYVATQCVDQSASLLMVEVVCVWVEGCHTLESRLR
jgi:hypothetical protein